MNQRERAAIFTDVYKKSGWGHASDGRPFYSDSLPHLTEPIRKLVGDFIKEKSIRSIVDFDCGDFELGSAIEMHDASYVGIDIYDELISWNVEHFGCEGRRFITADIVEDDLPDADLCMIHTVLYILSADP